ncbi:hypothetical protein [Actinomyces procaprae]|uniref:hypothetical protein n=1 Tax=Actinomyces procaprae TaxID=2560010 RepID=UPI0010A22653|nr:hypothetical protein [Actinomyces procaprae]
MARTKSYKPRHLAPRKRLVDVIRDAAHTAEHGLADWLLAEDGVAEGTTAYLNSLTDNTMEEVPAR